jgi:hypothetical protein
MSLPPIARSPDLKRLRDEGYNVQVVEGYLIVRDIPYLAGKGDVRRGILACALTLANNKALEPADHTARFAGAHPCHADGRQMSEIVASAQDLKIRDDVTTNFYLSAKPKPSDKYVDFYEKVTTYVRRLSGPVEESGFTDTARTFAVMPDDEVDPIFKYCDTASSRADIVEVTRKLRLGPVAILGLGGTGSYVLDFVAKTPVKEIHLFDRDRFQQHNAFRAPGAASEDDLEQQPYKVEYFRDIYSRMRHGIVPHPEAITSDNLAKLEGMCFVFICMEAGTVKRELIEWLLARGIPFVDVGMGVYLKNGTLGGLLRTTVGTAEKHNHLWSRIPMSDGGLKGEYDKNIQIAELNALNAALAVIRWKKLFGFYADQRGEHYCTYAIGRNDTNNEDAA